MRHEEGTARSFSSSTFSSPPPTKQAGIRLANCGSNCDDSLMRARWVEGRARKDKPLRFFSLIYDQEPLHLSLILLDSTGEDSGGMHGIIY